MKVRVSELEGRALNYAVAFIQWGGPEEIHNTSNLHVEFGKLLSYRWPSVTILARNGSIGHNEYNPSGNWAHGGPLIDKYATQLSAPSSFDSEGFIAATYARKKGQGLKCGNTFLVAFCRSLVSAIQQKDEIEIPDELMED